MINCRMKYDSDIEKKRRGKTVTINISNNIIHTTYIKFSLKVVMVVAE